MSVEYKVPSSSQLVDKQFFQIPGPDGILTGYQYDAEMKTLYQKESQVIIPSMHGVTHIAEDPIPNATCDTQGSMSADDKCRLDALLQMRIGVLGFQGAGFCVTPDTEILFADGTHRTISQVKEGNLIVTHDGSTQFVTKTFRRHINEQIISFNVRGHRKDGLKLTKDHKILAIKRGNLVCIHPDSKARSSCPCRNANRDRCNNCEYHNLSRATPQWIKASDLDVGDFVVNRFCAISNKESNKLRVQDYIENLKLVGVNKFKTISSRNQCWTTMTEEPFEQVHNTEIDFPEEIIITKNFMRLLGYYLAEGWIGHKQKTICLSLNKNEEFTVGKDIQDICKNEFGLEAKIGEDNKNSIQVTIHSSILAKMIEKLCGKYSHDKMISEEIFNQDDSLIAELLYGLFRGDGHAKSSYATKNISLTLVGKQLVEQTAALCERIGGKPSLYKPITKKNSWFKLGKGTKEYSTSYAMTVQASTMQWLYRRLGKEYTKSNKFSLDIKCDQYSLREITNKQEYQYEGEVCDLTIENNHSMVANGVVIHNSDDGGFLTGDILLAAGSEFITLERVGNTVRFTVQSPIPLNCGCFEPGCKLTMADGTTKNIEEAKDGELIITHEGRIKKITKILSADYNGEILDIKVHGHNGKFSVTPGHPLYAMSERVNSRRMSQIRDKSGVLLEQKSANWIFSHDVDKNDFLVKRYSHNNIINQEYFTLSDFTDKKFIIKNGKIYPVRKNWNGKSYYIDGVAYGVPNKILIDNDLMKLFGYYLAEGCSSERNGIRFTVHRNELATNDIGSEIIRIMRDKFGLEANIYNKPSCENSVDITFRSKILSNILIKLFGHRAWNKSIPEFILNLNPKLQYQLIFGFIQGDGSTRYSNKGVIRIEVSSNKLTDQMRFMSERSGLEFRSFAKRKISGFKAKIQREYDNIEYSATHNRKLFFDLTGVMPDEPIIYNCLKSEDEIYHKIYEISKRHYIGKVYNMEVEDDHSYIINGIVVHNCETCSSLFWIQDESEQRAIRPPSCNGIMPDVTAYGALKIFTLPESMVVDPTDPLKVLNLKDNFPAMIFQRYINKTTPYENEFHIILKRNKNLTTQTGWSMTPGQQNLVECVWFTGLDKNGGQTKFEYIPQNEPNLLGGLYYKGHLITKQMAVIVDYPSDVLSTNRYIIKRWDTQNAAPIGDSFTAINVWQYLNPENSSTSMANPKTHVLDATVEVLPIGTLVDIWEFEVSRTSSGRVTRHYFMKQPMLSPSSLWAMSGAVQFGDMVTAREEVNEQDNTAITANELTSPDIRLFEPTIWGLNYFEDRLILSDDGETVIASDGTSYREPSGEPVNNDIVADVDYTIPGLTVIKQTKTATGDLNGDGVIDNADLQIFLAAYCSKIGDINYNADADFNKDGYVDARDLAVIGAQFDLNIDKVPDTPAFLWHRFNHKNIYMKAKLGMPGEQATYFPPYDILLSAPVDHFDDTYVKAIRRGIITTGPFASMPFIVVKGVKWNDLPMEGVLRIMTGAFRNVIWKYHFKAAFSYFDDDGITLIGRSEIFPFDQDFPCGDTGGTGITAYDDVDVPINTTVAELLRQDFTSPCLRLQFCVNRTTGAESVQLQAKVGILDMGTPYEFNRVDVSDDDLVRGLAPGYAVSQVMTQAGFITDGVGADVESVPSGFRTYVGGELPAPTLGVVEKWNEIEVMYRDGQVWIWWNGMLIPPDPTLSAALPTPVAISTPYFPVTPQLPIGKVAIRMFPGAIVRSMEIYNQNIGFNEYTHKQLELTT